jgi:GNAT superfamily N-acetyltransferase
VLIEAGAAAWGSFLGRERIELANQDRSHPAQIVAVDDDHVLGFVAWDAATGEILRLYTHPRAWGRGAGAALLERALDALRDAGHSQAWLNTEERNERGRGFYARLGWRIAGPPRVREWHGVTLCEPRYVKDL